jgi:hypothetical protein
MSFWSFADFAFQRKLLDPINEEIWAESVTMQTKLDGLNHCDLARDATKPWHGAQQSMLEASIFGPAADGLVLPWVPDVLGCQWSHEDAVHIIGSAYAGFIQGISKRRLPFGAYLSTSRLPWHDFSELYLKYVIQGDCDYYEPLCPILELFGSTSRFSLFDLCRASLITRMQGARIDKPISLIRDDDAQKLFASHADCQVEWTWRRLRDSGRYVVALGFTAEYGLLRLLHDKGCQIKDSVAHVPWNPRQHRKGFAWTVNYPAQTIESRLESGAYWEVSHGQRRWKVIPIFHPQYAEGRQKDPGYEKTLRFLKAVI